MSEPRVRIYLLYGDDDLVIRETTAALRSKLGDPTVSDMNTSAFSARNLDLAEFETICKTLPFLAERRIVILEHAEVITAKTPWMEKLLAILESSPEKTAIMIHEHVDSSEKGSEDRYQKRSVVYKWASAHAHICWIKSCLIPQKGAFARWITDRVKFFGGEIDAVAAQQLSEITAGDPLLADQEIRKLLDFSDYKRSITASDIELLTPLHGEADIFTLVDAMGNRDATRALRELHHLQEEVSGQVIFSMVLRQFRLLIQARDCLDRNLVVRDVLPLHPFVVEKISRQAQNFRMPQLLDMYGALQQLDMRLKSSSIDMIVALDSLIARFAAV